jgi:hypothetical protein
MAKLARFLRMDHVLKHGSKEVKRLIITVFAGNLYGVYEPGLGYLQRLEMLYKKTIRAVFRVTRSTKIPIVF